MIRIFIVILLTLSASFSARAQEMRPFNQVSIVALVMTSGTETPVSSRVTETLESLDAQVLTVTSANASQMRSILKRFAGAALDVDVALVFYDGAVLKIGDREFVAPDDITLRRPSDLLTRAIPLSAFARATALANEGGAVLVHSAQSNITLINGVSLAENAPMARTGTSPVLLAQTPAVPNLVEALAMLTETDGDISLGAALTDLAAINGVSISQSPMGTAMLRVYPAPVATPPAVEADTGAGTPEPMAANAEPDSDASNVPTLPQVGDGGTPQTTAADVAATVETLENTAQATTGPDDTNTTENTSETSGAATTQANEGTTEATPEPVNTDSELSIDVLRAMQGALSRSQKKVVQKKLREMRYYRGLIDGIFGPQTAAAISAYQESINANVTGVLTPLQLEALSQ